jgi:hypothetical protein
MLYYAYLAAQTLFICAGAAKMNPGVFCTGSGCTAA